MYVFCSPDPLEFPPEGILPLGKGRACVRARVFAFQASPSQRAQRTTRRAFRPSGVFSHSSRGLSFMRWELDTHACVRVFAYVDIAIALLSAAGPLLRLRMCSFFYEMGNGCACVNARALHEYISIHSCTPMNKTGFTARASATIRLTPELVQ